MELNDRTVHAALDRLMPDAVEFLGRMIAIPSTRGNEGPVNRLVHQVMGPLCDSAVLMQIPESFTEDPDYSWPMPGLSYRDTQNVRLTLAGTRNRGSRSVLFNAHSDVVPASRNQKDPFTPVIRDGRVYGRGACDDKGQIAVLYLLLRALHELGLAPRGDVVMEIVVEEENGGNGTLFMTRHPVRTDAAVVMEASDGKVFAAVRGAVWFELEVLGRPGHSGRAQDVVSALKEAVKGLGILEECHDRLLASSRGKNPLFDVFENPMPVTFGMMNAGDWPATAPATATVKGVFGFLPDTNVRAVQQMLGEALRNSAHPWLREHAQIRFTMLNNDGNAISPEHPLVCAMLEGAQSAGAPLQVSALTAACDAWRYNNVVGIPTVVYGAGSLKYAHSNEEHVALDDLRQTALVLLRFLERWCGFDPRGGA